jgi:N-acetylglucosamine repressor
MGTYTAANSQWAKQVNRTQILRLLLSRGPLSRKQLASITGLTSGAVSMITKEMLAAGLLREVGKDPAASIGAGRRAVLLDVVPTCCYAVGVEIVPQWVMIVITDLKGVVRHQRLVPGPETRPPEAAMEIVRRELADLFREVGAPKNRYVGIGMALPGFVDGSTGILTRSMHFSWLDVPFGDWLASEFDLPVVVENDVRCRAAVECGQAYTGQGVILFVYVGFGIGGSIVVDRRPLRGYRSAAGEIGHMLIDPDGPACSCGYRGCLEALAANPATVARARAAMLAGKRTMLNDLSEPDALNTDMVIQAALAEDTVARDALRESGRYLGLGIASAVNLLAPQVVIITGKVMRAGQVFSDAVRESFMNRSLNLPGEPPNLVFLPFTREACAAGAAATALQSFLLEPAEYARTSENMTIH